MSTFTVDATLTSDCAQAVCNAGLAQILAGVDLVDCKALQHFDSCALAVFLCWQRAAQEQGRVVHMHNIPAALASLARAYGASALCFGLEAA